MRRGRRLSVRARTSLLRHAYEPTRSRRSRATQDLIPTPTGDLHLGSRFTNKVPGSHPFGIIRSHGVQTGRFAWKLECRCRRSRASRRRDLVFFGEGNGKVPRRGPQTGTSCSRSIRARARSQRWRRRGFPVRVRREMAASSSSSVRSNVRTEQLRRRRSDSGKVGDAISPSAAREDGDTRTTEPPFDRRRPATAGAVAPSR